MASPIESSPEVKHFFNIQARRPLTVGYLAEKTGERFGGVYHKNYEYIQSLVERGILKRTIADEKKVILSGQEEQLPLPL